MHWRQASRDAAAWNLQMLQLKGPLDAMLTKPLALQEIKWRSTAVICSQSQRSACLLVAEAHKYALTRFLCFSGFSFVFLITEFA